MKYRFTLAVYYLSHSLLFFFITPWLIIIAQFSRFLKKKIDIGIGPEPLINNVHHKKALILSGYSAETFVHHVFFITDDFDFSSKRYGRLGWLVLFIRSIFRYRCLLIYFTGGPLSKMRYLFPIVEPYLYKLASVKLIVLPYGSDIQDFLVCTNLSFKNAMFKDYPFYYRNRRNVVRQIVRWTEKSDYVISGCDWVDYMYHWDELMLGHFSIDTDLFAPPDPDVYRVNETIRILHAPNHQNLKGTKYFMNAVKELKDEGYNIEIELVTGIPNDELRSRMSKADIIADQLIIGWYAMSAIEGMSLGKPVLCFLRKDLEELYIEEGLIEEDEIPLVRCSKQDVKDKIRDLISDRCRMESIGKMGRNFVIKHHSLQSIGMKFQVIGEKIGLRPIK